MPQDISYLLGSLGVTFLLGLSAYGSCHGMRVCGSSAALHSGIPAIITYSYVSMIIISTVFFYAFILAIIIINRLGAAYGLEDGLRHLFSGILFGSIGFSSGKAMGGVAQEGFRRLAKHPGFFVTYLIALASVEVTLVIAFLCTLLVIYAPQ